MTFGAPIGADRRNRVDLASGRFSASVSVVRRFIAASRYAWSSGLFALMAAVLLAVGAGGSGAASTALVGAGSALAGVAGARFIDLDRERRAEQRAVAESRKRDLDETRRLAYFALMSKGTRNYELAATVTNAIEHHQQGAEFGEAFKHLKTLADGGPGDISVAEDWIYSQIFEIGEELGDIPEGRAGVAGADSLGSDGLVVPAPGSRPAGE